MLGSRSGNSLKPAVAMQQLLGKNICCFDDSKGSVLNRSSNVDSNMNFSDGLVTQMILSGVVYVTVAIIIL